MGKEKKGLTQQTEQKPPATESKLSGQSHAATKSLEKLSLEVKKLGQVLGVEEGQMDKKQEDKVQVKDDEQEKSQFQRPEMTAEEKKAQRAAKAAEKKMKAEAAKNKKANAETIEQPQQAKQKESQQKQKQTQTPQGQNQKRQEMQNANGKQTHNTAGEAKKENRKEIKSALRTSNSFTGKEVKFDLIASTSDDKTNAAEAEPEPIRSTTNVHPAFIELSTQLEEGNIDSLDELCKLFIDATINLVNSPTILASNDNGSGESLTKRFEAALKLQITYFTFNGKWSLPHALGNIVRLMRKEADKIEHTHHNNPETLAKRLVELKETNFTFAYEAISSHVQQKLTKSRQLILTYDWCPLVHRILEDAAEKDKSKVFCFVDDELGARGMQHVKKFTRKGIRSEYLNLNSISYVMQNCCMVILGCAAVHSNGSVSTWLGSLQLALVARHFNVPILVVAQTFKFVAKFESHGRQSVIGRKEMELLPADMITAIVTDFRFQPPSAAPAVLKAKDLEAE